MDLPITKMNTFSERLREMRKFKGLSQRQVAETLKLSTRTYAHYEQGDREPNIATLTKLCDLLDVPADYLIGRIDY